MSWARHGDLGRFSVAARSHGVCTHANQRDWPSTGCDGQYGAQRPVECETPAEAKLGRAKSARGLIVARPVARRI